MRPLPSPRNARTRSAAAGSRDAIRGGLDRQLGGPMVAPDGHLNAALAEAGELLPYLGEALHGARRDCQLEPRPIARPQRDLGDQLLGADAKMVSDQASNVRFHEFLHAPPSRDRRDAPR